MIDDYTKEQLRAGLLPYVQSITKADRRAGHNMFICPLCGSGAGKGKGKTDGAFSVTKDGKAWKCFSCQEGGDIFALIEKHEGIDDFTEQAKRAADITGVRITQDREAPREKKQPSKGDAIDWEEKPKAEEKTQPAAGRYLEYIKQCHENITKTDYFKQRGFTDEIIERFLLGFDPEKQAVVIPYGKNGTYYITRDIKTPINQTEGRIIRKPKTEEAGEEPLFNKGALKAEKPCFICEAPIDAISIIQAGAGKCNAVSIGGTGGIKLLKALEEITPQCEIFLCLDNDSHGQAAADKIGEELNKKGITYHKADFTLKAYPEDSRKDANDLLRGNPEQLTKDIAAMTDPAERYKQKAAASHIRDFYASIEAELDTPAISTGFKELDHLLGDGIRTGLYVIGALSSLGKTTFIVQLADYIAKQGHDVLFFSLEQPEREIMAKSISRETYNAAIMKTGDTKQAKSTMGILNGRRYKQYTQDEKQIIKDATAQYMQYADRIHIIEGVGNVGTQEIESRIKAHEKHTGNKPICFLDYLQIMTPPTDGRRSYTDKQATDKNILELKRLSRNYTIIAISSFNRDSYTEPVNLASFKESGAIEYTADVLIGLQFAGMDYRTEKDGKRESEAKHAARVSKEVMEVQQERGKRGQAQDIELKVLKNRNNIRGKADLLFYPCFNLYQDAGTTRGTTEPDAQGFTYSPNGETPFDGVRTFDFEDEIQDDGKQKKGRKKNTHPDADFIEIVPPPVI